MTKEKLIYEMLTECTGKALCDSGDAYGRHWERNQKKTLEDFRNEPAVSFDFAYNIVDHDYLNLSDIEYEISVFHFLNSDYLELDFLCESFNSQFVPAKDWYAQEGYGFSEEAENKLKEMGFKFTRTFNTANSEDFLTQTLQGTFLELNGRQYVLLQIHQGCDIRGGYTDARLFYLPEGFLPCQDVIGKIDGFPVSNLYDGSNLKFEEGEPEKITTKSQIELTIPGI